MPAGAGTVESDVPVCGEACRGSVDAARAGRDGGRVRMGMGEAIRAM